MKTTIKYFQQLIEDGNIKEFKAIIKKNKLLFLIPLYNPEFKHYYLNYAIHKVIISGKMDFFIALYEDEKIHVEIDRNYSVYKAAEYGHSHILKILIEDENVDITDRSRVALIESVRNGHLSTTKLLIETGLFDDTYVFEEAIFSSINGNNFDNFEYLMNYYFEVFQPKHSLDANNIFDKSFFATVLLNNNPKIIDYILNNKFTSSSIEILSPTVANKFKKQSTQHKITAF